MIDVIFLLLVFFMLASRFGLEAVLPLPLAASGSAPYEGPPRLVDITPDAVRLNGVIVSDLIGALKPLMANDTDMIILRGKDGATVQHIVTVSEQLGQAGYQTQVLAP